MTQVVCDCCAKGVDPKIGRSPVRGVEYFTQLDKAFCKSCSTKLDNAVREQMDKQSKFDFLYWKKVVREIVTRYCNKTRGVA